MFHEFKTTIDQEWTESGHLSIGGYVTLFDQATDSFREHLGLGRRYAAETNCGMYVAEIHMTYERELRAGDEICINSVLLNVDAKKIHLLHQMQLMPDAKSVAAVEMIILHVSRDIGRTISFPEPILARMRTLATDDDRETLPAMVGRSMTLNRTRTD